MDDQQRLIGLLEDSGMDTQEAEAMVNGVVAKAVNPNGLWPPMPPVGDFVQLDDGGIFRHVERSDFREVYSGMAFPWSAIGQRVVAHGTIHWRNPFGGNDR